MGHYASEMGYEAPLSKPERESREVKRELGERGYVGPAVKHYGDTIHLSEMYNSPGLLLHKLCGAAVFDPDSHDQYCPARKKPLWKRGLSFITRS
jgi:hypothetical protein